MKLLQVSLLCFGGAIALASRLSRLLKPDHLFALCIVRNPSIVYTDQRRDFLLSLTNLYHARTFQLHFFTTEAEDAYLS